MESFDMLAHYVTIDGTVMYRNYAKYREDILNFEVFDDDVWVASFLKSGTTWTQEMVWLIMKGLDFSASLEKTLDLRFPFLEVSTVDPLSNMTRLPDGYVQSELLKNSVDFLRQFKRPRFIKTHLPWKFLPLQIQEASRKPKIIYVVRNPKDVCVSFYHHARIIDGYSGTLEDFCELFLTDKGQGNILIVKYEEMKANLPVVINKVAHFLGKSLTKEDVDKLGQHLSFDSMKNNSAVNKNEALETLRKYNITSFKGDFMRCGKVGSHKSEMSPVMMRRFDKWIEKNSGQSFN